MKKKQGSGEAARQLIRLGASDSEALAFIKLLYPQAKTTLTTINHYRAKMKADFEDVETNSAAPGLDLDRLRNLVLHGESESADSSAPSIRSIRRTLSSFTKP